MALLHLPLTSHDRCCGELAGDDGSFDGGAYAVVPADINPVVTTHSGLNGGFRLDRERLSDRFSSEQAPLIYLRSKPLKQFFPDDGLGVI